MLRPRGGFSNQNEFEKAQVENLVTNENLVTTYKNLWKWAVGTGWNYGDLCANYKYVQSAYNT